jgi:sulfate/thiosulfate transport system substrate-binding protein
MKHPSGRISVLALSLLSIVAAACGGDAAGENINGTGGACTPPEVPTITFAAYSTPREVYGGIIPAFRSMWKETHDDQDVIFQESYGGSTTQAQNVINGFEADVVALSLGPDVDTIADAGLITHDWTAVADGGMVSSSIVVFDVRPGNPAGIEDFDDLAQSGMEVLTPDPVSSGGARWNIVAAYGSALRGHAGSSEGDQTGAQDLLEGIFRNVIALDRTARDSIKNFESGNGDVAITYENEVLTARDTGLPDEMVIPPSTVLIENPVAVVDVNADKHCVREVADAFVEFLHTPEAKELYSSIGFLRGTDADEAAAGDGPGGQFPAIEDLFTVDDLGGWEALNEQVFGEEGVFTQAFESAQG